MCIHVYECMSKFNETYTNTSTNTICTHMRATHMRSYMHANITHLAYVCVCLCICKFVCMSVCMHAHIYACMCV